MRKRSVFNFVQTPGATPETASLRPPSSGSQAPSPEASLLEKKESTKRRLLRLTSIASTLSMMKSKPAADPIAQRKEADLVAFETLPRITKMLDPTRVVLRRAKPRGNLAGFLASKPPAPPDEEGEEAQQFPTGKELHDMLPELRDLLIANATESLRRLSYNRLVLRARRKARRNLTRVCAMSAQRPTVEFLQSRPAGVFAPWPTKDLRQLVDGLRYVVVERGEYLVHDGEPATSGIFIVTSGAAKQYQYVVHEKTGERQRKERGRMQVPAFYGEFGLLTEDCHTMSVKATQRCDAWMIAPSVFQPIFQSLPMEVQVAIISAAFKERNKFMADRMRMSVPQVMLHAIFRHCPSSLIEAFIHSMRPFAVPKGFLVCTGGEPADSMFFVINGRCAVYKEVGGEATHINTLVEGALIADVAVLCSTSYEHTIRTASHCDLFELTKRDFEACVRMYPSALETMFESTRRQRQDELYLQQLKYRSLVLQFPILKEIIPHRHLRELIRLFVPKVYKAMTILCSTADFCDRVILLTRGRVRIGLSDLWRVGEFSGFTCLIPHRWGSVAITQEVVECLELPLDVFRAFCQDMKVYDEVKEISLQLMFPKAFDSSKVVRADSMVRHQRSPPMYPMSLSNKINLNEPNFSYTRPSHHQTSPAVAAEFGSAGSDAKPKERIAKKRSEVNAREARSYSRAVDLFEEEQRKRKHNSSTSHPRTSSVAENCRGGASGNGAPLPAVVGGGRPGQRPSTSMQAVVPARRALSSMSRVSAFLWLKD